MSPTASDGNMENRVKRELVARLFVVVLPAPEGTGAEPVLRELISVCRQAAFRTPLDCPMVVLHDVVKVLAATHLHIHFGRLLIRASVAATTRRPDRPRVPESHSRSAIVQAINRCVIR
jgi:hypothetical protein